MKKLQFNIKETKFYKSKFIQSLDRWVRLFDEKFLSRGEIKFVLFLYLIAFLAYGFTLLTSDLTLPLSGDFTIQEIPFYYNAYDDWWTFFRTGEFPYWDTNTNLGVNNIGSNSFYYLMNIFVIPIVLVPRSLIPQAQAFMMITKFVLAGYFMKKLLVNMFKVSKDSATLVGLCYAFSGWSLFYLWFNHFLEIAILMPLVLYGIEKVLQERKVSTLILMIFLSGLTNYFFLIMFCFCGVMYAVFRYFQLFKSYSKKERWQVIVLGVVGFAVGLMMALCILLPCFSVALNSSRASSSSSYVSKLKDCIKDIIQMIKTGDFVLLRANLDSLINLLFRFNTSNNLKVYLYPLVEFFYPTISCYDHMLFNNTGYDNTLSSLYVYMPVVLMFIPAILHSIKTKKISHIIGVIGLSVLIFTPFAYYCFSGFTNVSYGRWFIFVVAVLCIYVAKTFDDRERMKRWYLDVSRVITLMMEILLYVYATLLQDSSGSKKFESGIQILVAIHFIYTFILYLYMRKKFFDKGLPSKLTLLAAAEIIVMGNILMQFQGTTNYDNLFGGQKSVNNEMVLLNRVREKDDGFYRVYNTSSTRTYNNIGMVENYNGLGTFHSIYGYDLNDFLNWTHFTYSSGGWSMGDHEKRINLETFLNVKYYLFNKSDNNIPFGLEKEDEYDGKILYRNTNYVPLGFNYDELVDSSAIKVQNRSEYDNFVTLSSYQAYVVKNERLFIDKNVLSPDDYDQIRLTHPHDFVYNDTISYTSSFNDIYKVIVPSKNITVYQAEWDETTHKFIENKNVGAFSKEKVTALKWNSQLDVDTKDLNVAYSAKSRGGAFVTVKQRIGENLSISLYGEKEDGEEYLLCSDRHLTHYYNKNSDFKYERGFYVNDRVTRVKITVYDTLGASNYLVRPDITYEYYDSYQKSLQRQFDEPITDIKVSTNKYEFKTDYSKTKMVCLTIPYDKGWSLRDSSNNEIKIYKGQGGFISFIAPKGEMNYKLEYTTTYLHEGMYGFLIGSMILSLLYYGLEVKREEKEYIKKATNLN